MIVFLVTYLKSNLLLANCNIEHDIMYAIAMNEKHIKKEVGYPYLISFNNSNDWKIKNEILKKFDYRVFKGDKRSIDCVNEENCKKITKKLINTGIINMDLGAYQICYRWFPYKDLATYFNLAKSYMAGCSIVYNNVIKYGNSWETICYYHSRTKKLNQRYCSNLQANLVKTYPNKYTFE